MSDDEGQRQREGGPPPEFSAAGSFARYMEHLPGAFAVTVGAEHSLAYANAAFRTRVARGGHQLLGTPITTAVAIRDAKGLTAVLDRAFRSGAVARNCRIGPIDEIALPLSCSVWPDVNDTGDTQYLVVELRDATPSELTLAIQREVAERLLLSALREQEAAAAAEQQRIDASFLASESRRLAESLDEGDTLEAMASMSLSHLGDWCIVDVLDQDDTMHRIAVLHPDPEKQVILHGLEGRWVPQAGDGFGLPAMLRTARSSGVVVEDVDEMLRTAAGDPDVHQALLALGIGPLLTIPLVVRKRLIGAITFVSGNSARPFTAADIELAQNLSSHSALALDRARAYGEALTLKVKAEQASTAKSEFLGMMSHELRTPLHAIGGYVDLLDMGLHGPVTSAQQVDLDRIRTNQRYLVRLISDLLDFTSVGSGKLQFNLSEFVVHDMLSASVALVAPLISEKGLVFDGLASDARIVARGDPEKVIQIVVNLLSNAIKFTPAGERIAVEYRASGAVVEMVVSDTGIGISADKLDVIFDPFVQVKDAFTGPLRGVGLGLAISRSLARGMSGNLTVQSTPGEGSRFTLVLPKSAGHQAGPAP